MIALVILLAVLLDFAIGVAVGKFLRAGQIDDVMDLADAVQSDTPLGEYAGHHRPHPHRLQYVAVQRPATPDYRPRHAPAREMGLDPIDPAAVERIRGVVLDELAVRRCGGRAELLLDEDALRNMPPADLEELYRDDRTPREVVERIDALGAESRERRDWERSR